MNDYFYEVAPHHVREGRPQYDAQAGYIGTEIGFSAAIPVNDRLRIFAGVDYEIYDGAENQDSPLFKRDEAVSGGVAFVYTFFQSAERSRSR